MNTTFELKTWDEAQAEAKKHYKERLAAIRAAKKEPTMAQTLSDIFSAFFLFAVPSAFLHFEPVLLQFLESVV